jgi:hypothetical protein
MPTLDRGTQGHIPINRQVIAVAINVPGPSAPGLRIGAARTSDRFFGEWGAMTTNRAHTVERC